MARLLQTPQTPSLSSPNGALAESLDMLDGLGHAGLSLVSTFPSNRALLKAANETGLSQSQVAQVYAIMLNADD